MVLRADPANGHAGFKLDEANKRTKTSAYVFGVS